MNTTRESFYFFWGGPLSNWHICSFTLDGLDWNCVEQYMMASKARLFGDAEAWDMIRKEASPKRQKRLGSMVEGFQDSVWVLHAKLVVYRGCLAKFSQIPDLKQNLLETDGKTIVEANPFDCRWGIGWGMDDMRRLSRSEWRGSNWLGDILTQVREDIRHGVY